jgi:hypothetical protein
MINFQVWKRLDHLGNLGIVIKMDEIECVGLDWPYLAQVNVHWTWHWGCGFHKRWGISWSFMTSHVAIWFSRRTLFVLGVCELVLLYQIRVWSGTLVMEICPVHSPRIFFFKYCSLDWLLRSSCIKEWTFLMFQQTLQM